jgi:TldD protein
MKKFAKQAIDAACSRGATYADVRLIETQEQLMATQNGEMETLLSTDSVGMGIRTIVNGAWGFAACHEISRDSVEKTARQAVAVAKASAMVKAGELRLAPLERTVATWHSPCKKDPFKISLETKLDLLMKVDHALRAVKGVTLARASLLFIHTQKLYMSSLGSYIEQSFYQTGGGFTAYSFQNGELQKRSYPNSFGGQHQLGGYEVIEALRFLDHAARVGEEAVALHQAEQCPRRRTTVILDSSQLALQIHESIGHPIELDRVLGFEANYAGTSFLTLDTLGRLQYASPVVNVVADARLSHGPGLGTFGYDDEGVPAQRVEIIREGLFVGYLTSRETAAMVGQGRSNGTMRADGWNHIPLIRMTNISLLPGTGRLEDLMADTPDGIYMETNRSWSIDDKRYHFQFGTEIAWEIKKGKKTRMLKNPSYGGITTQFWNSCDAVCGQDEWDLWGLPNCGKGQPGQVIGTGHGAAPARFRNVEVGVAYT